LDFLQKAPADEDDPHGAATSAIDTALGVTGTVQDIRSALGAPAASCQKPRIVPYPLPHRDDHSRIGLRPAMVVDLQTGTNDVWGTFIDVHEVREPRHVAEEWWTVDVNLTLTPAPDSGEMQVLSIARTEDLYREEDRLREAPMFSFTSDQSPPPGTRTIGPNGADAAAVRHGWVTSLCRGRPTMIGVRTRFELIDLNLAKMPRAGMIGLLPIHPRLASAGQPADHGQ
jgi:hypothetical protein